MSARPLRTLLRGCTKTSAHLPKRRPSNGSNHGSDSFRTVTDITAFPSSGQELPTELDFFNDDTAASEKKSVKSKHLPIVQKLVSEAKEVEDSNHLDANLSNLVREPRLRTALARMKISSATPVQRRVIPPLLEGRDVVAIAPTGSGKTLAYALPLLMHLYSPELTFTPGKPMALILAPTTELANQISRVFNRLSTEGGLKLRFILLTSRSALASLASKPARLYLIIATPQSAVSAVTSGKLDLSRVRHIVLDEADELLQEKFLPQVDTVLAAANAHESDGPRTHLFSATLPSSIDELARSMLRDVRKIVVDGGDYGGSAAVNRVSDSISQRFVFVGGRGEQGKVIAVRSLLKEGLKLPILIFVQSKERAAELFRELIFDGIKVDAIHGDRTAAARESAVERFRAGHVWVLIATDLLARGLDFLSINTVINYDMPSSPTAYVHRIGRTGRNGRTGSAITLFTEEDKKLVGSVVKVARASGADVPDWLINLGEKVRNDELKRLEKRPPKRKQVGGPNRASLKPRKKKRRAAASETVGAKADAEAVNLVSE